jgi:Outer membrane protein beta-barrel domain
MKRTVFLLMGGLLVASAVPARAQNFLQQSAETIDRGNFKIAGFPTVLFGKNGGESQWGVAGRFGYGFTDNFDVEGKVAFFDNFKLYGADAEFWVVKGQIDVSVAGGLHKAAVDHGFDSTAFDAAALVSGEIAPKLDLYGGLSLSFESLDDVNDSDFTRAYVVPGLEYKLNPQLDLVAEVGIGLNDDSPHYVSFGLAFYVR